MSQTIDRFKSILIAADGNKKKMDAAIDRISSYLAGSILGRDFGESVEHFLNNRPDIKAVHDWSKTVQISSSHKVISA